MSTSTDVVLSRAIKALSIGSDDSASASSGANTEQSAGRDIKDIGSTAFPLFSSLPIELRLQIWSYALRQPTLIPIYLAPLKPIPFIRHGSISSIWPIDSFRPPPSIGSIKIPLHLTTLNPEERVELDFATRINLSNLAGFRSITAAPQIAYVNHETYEVVSKAFSKAFSTHCAIPTTWFDYEHDTLLLSMDSKTGFFVSSVTENNFLTEVLSRMNLAERSLVRHICVDLRLCTDHDCESYMWLGWCVVSFPNCRTLSFELPNTKVVMEEAGEGLLLGEAVQAKKDLFAEYFEHYRRFGTVAYEVVEWKKYLSDVHGERGVVVRECCVDSLQGGGECNGESILMV